MNDEHVHTIKDMLDLKKCPICKIAFPKNQVRYLVEHRDTWTFRHHLLICIDCEGTKPIDYFRVATIEYISID